MFKERGHRSLNRRVFRGNRHFFISSARIHILMELAHTERLQVDYRRFFQINERFGLQGGHSRVLADVFCSFTGVVLYVMASKDSELIRARMLASTIPPHLPVNIDAPNYGFYGREVFLSFGSPTYHVYGIRVRTISLVRYRYICLFLRGFFEGRVAKCVRRWTTVDRAEAVLRFGEDGKVTYSQELEWLRRYLSSMRRSHSQYYASGSSFQDSKRNVAFKEERLFTLFNCRREGCILHVFFLSFL